MVKLTKHKASSIKKGFTLPELLIVMTVIAGLASIMVVSYPAAQQRTRDTRRKSDLKQYQTSIEIYANKKGDYSGLSNGNLAGSGNCTVLGLSNCPDDPKSPTQHYRLFVDPSQYVLSVRLDRPVLPANPYFTICSNGKTGEHTSQSGPACPLP